MARGIARIGDRTDGTCYHPSHLVPLAIGGTIITGSSKVVCDGNRLAATLGDEVETDCGHIAYIITATAKVLIGHKAQFVARLGDQIDDGAPYKAKIVTASNKTFPQG
jgi:uncharacterized Zn-binding protein involved in type VI secretion